MPSVLDVKGSELVKAAAQKLKGVIKRPEYISYVKSGADKERPPQDPDFWFMRSASILRQVYLRGPVGVSRLRTRYGTGKEHNGMHRHHHVKAGGSVIRDSMNALEAASLVKKTKNGRVITPKGRSFLDRISREVAAAGQQGQTQ